MRSFVKIKPSQISQITFSFTNIGQSRPCREFSTSQICVLTLFAKIKLSQKISEFTVFGVMCHFQAEPESCYR